jgi:ankyrin repeat protein
MLHGGRTYAPVFQSINLQFDWRYVMTALMNAVKNNDVALVRELIQQGVNVNELDANKDASLIIAAYKGYTEIVKLLLEAGADVSVVDPGMQATALHAAAYAGHAQAAKLLIEHNIDIDKQGPYNGYTALHDAVWQNNIETARALIEAGANLHIKSHTGETPLEFAKSRNHREIVALIEQKMG